MQCDEDAVDDEVMVRVSRRRMVRTMMSDEMRKKMGLGNDGSRTSSPWRGRRDGPPR
jgi:hypothetical protein